MGFQWQSNDNEQGANKIFIPGKELPSYKPEKQGTSLFRPLARPYPADVLSLIPQAAEEAKKIIAQGAPFKTEAFTSAFMVACQQLTAGIPRRIVCEPSVDLFHATLQAFATGTMPVFENWRHGNMPYDIGWFAVMVNVASYFGMDKKKISVLDHTSNHPELEAVGVFQKTFDAINNAVKQGNVQWSQYLKVYGASNQGASRPKQTVLVQAMMFEHAGVQAPQGQPEYCTFHLNATSRQSLEKVWNEHRGGVMDKVIPEDFVRGYKVGDILDPAAGSAWAVYNAKAVQQHQQPGAGMFSKPKGGGGNRSSDIDYTVQLSPNSPMPAQYSQHYFQQWDDVLWVPTREQAWELVLECMGVHVTAFAGKDEIHVLPESVRSLAQQYATAPAPVTNPNPHHGTGSPHGLPSLGAPPSLSGGFPGAGPTPGPTPPGFGPAPTAPGMSLPPLPPLPGAGPAMGGNAFAGMSGAPVGPGGVPPMTPAPAAPAVPGLTLPTPGATPGVVHGAPAPGNFQMPSMGPAPTPATPPAPLGAGSATLPPLPTAPAPVTPAASATPDVNAALGDMAKAMASANLAAAGTAPTA